MSQIGAGKFARNCIPNVPNRKNINSSPTAKIFTEQTENLSLGKNTLKRSKRQTNSLLNIKETDLLSSSSGPTSPTVVVTTYDVVKMNV